MKLLLALLLLTVPAHAKTYTITNDGGGVVKDYGAHWAKHRKDYFVIAGNCFSSCTMVLGNYPNVCVTRNAVLGFHRAYTWTLLGYVTSHEWTEYMWKHYPADIQKLLNKHGGLLKDRGGFFNPKLLALRGSQLPSRYWCK